MTWNLSVSSTIWTVPPAKKTKHQNLTTTITNYFQHAEIGNFNTEFNISSNDASDEDMFN